MTVWLSWKISEEERVPKLRYTNEVNVDYVTAGPTNHLYGYLDRLRKKASYYDRDSFILIHLRA